MTDYLKVFRTRRMTKIMAVFAHSCGTFYVVGQPVVSFYGYPEVVEDSHLIVTSGLT